MNYESYFPVSSDILEEPIFQDKKDGPDLLRMWLYLNSVAAYKDGIVRQLPHGGVTLKKGECVFSIRDSAEILGISKDRAFRLVRKLENAGFCDRETKKCDKKRDRRNTRLMLIESGFVKIKPHKSATKNATRNKRYIKEDIDTPKVVSNLPEDKERDMELNRSGLEQLRKELTESGDI